ncbi:MAG: DEAD/DEAH box helicase [Mycoplasmoidaceae bacterium]
MEFKDLKLSSKILDNVKNSGYIKPTQIQMQVIPLCLDKKDIFGLAQTGTGKTASFALPLIQMLSEHKHDRRNGCIKYLVLTPTRELAMQVYENFKKYSYGLNQKYVCLYGGFSKKRQIDIIKMGVDIAICTPGRLLDILNMRKIDISKVETIVLDEADIMLDMGFIGDVKTIISKLPTEHQTLFFSATFPTSIKKLVQEIMRYDYVNITVAPSLTTIDSIEQLGYCINKKNKKEILLHLIKEHHVKSAIVFARTKVEVDALTRYLKNERINANSIHGDKEQRQRDRIINDFRNHRIRILVATDVASRGIHVDDISHIFNYDLPDSVETYVHRIGRTGRANKKGVAISLFGNSEKEKIAKIQKVTNKDISLQYVDFDTMQYSPMFIERYENKGDKSDAYSQKRRRSGSRNRSFGNNRNRNFDRGDRYNTNRSYEKRSDGEQNGQDRRRSRNSQGRNFSNKNPRNNYNK